MATDYTQELIQTARAVASPGKGILAADESTGTIGKRFDEIKVENNTENRRAYRELLFTSPNIGNFISGVILYDETLRQSTKDGRPFADVLRHAGIVVGIKVDKGTVNLPHTDGETATQGLDDLHKRCQEYYKLGARFAKWRAVLKISSKCPTQLAIIENAHTLARYAAICQANGLVPIVEPEILMDGDHTLETSAEVTERVLAATFKALNDHHVLLEGALLKPNMVLPGASCPTRASPEEVARATIRVLQRTVPAALPGIVFLSGGQTEEEATLNLNAMNALNTQRPWNVSFSYGRALQASCLRAWLGQEGNVAAAQQEFLKRAEANSQAQLGRYHGGAGGAAANRSQFVSGYTY